MAPHLRCRKDNPQSPAVVLSVRMRDVLGASDHLKGLGQAAGIEWRIVTGARVGGERGEALGHDPLRGSALEHTLPTSVVGRIEAVQQGFQILVAGHRDAQSWGRATAMPHTSRGTRPLKRSTMPFVRGV